MNDYEKYYKELEKKYSTDEIAESMMIPEKLSEIEKKKSDSEFRKIRFQLLNEQTENQRIYSDILRLKYQIVEYIENENFQTDKTFGKYLEEYIRILKKTKKATAKDLNIHYTRLSRLINERDEPNVELTYRLEEHCGNLISAIIWWKLVIKKQENDIIKNYKKRKTEAKKVKNALKIAV